VKRAGGSDKLLTAAGGRVSEDSRPDARITGNLALTVWEPPLFGPMALCGTAVRIRRQKVSE
jgi:hypothetical protein